MWKMNMLIIGIKGKNDIVVFIIKLNNQRG